MHDGAGEATRRRQARRSARAALSGAVLVVALSACARNASNTTPTDTAVGGEGPAASAANATTVPVPTTLLVIPVYIVKQGDTMGKIAKNLGVSLETLMAANGLSNANKISIGQKLRIPASATTVPASPATPTTTA